MPTTRTTPVPHNQAPPSPDLTDPLWTIEHLARVFFVEVDTVRDYAYLSGFPEPVKFGRRYLWIAAEVLPWVTSQPRHSAADRRRPNQASSDSTVDTSARPLKDYSPRSKKAAA